MRGDSGFAENKNVRASADLLQRDTIKVVNMADLARELSGELENTVVPPPPTSPADYWKRYFERNHSVTPLVVTVPPENTEARRPAQLSLTLGENLSDRLRTFADQAGVPFGVLFHASWGLLLHRYCGEDEVIFGLVKGCIQREPNESGPGVHIVPSRMVFDPAACVRPWLRALADQAKDAAPFEFISLDQIRAAAELPPGTPIFETVLSVGHESFEPMSIAAEHRQKTQATDGKYGLVAAVYLAREITLRVAYAADTFSEAAIKFLLGHWSMLLGSMCECAEEPVSSVRMLTTPEREHLINRLNSTAALWPSSACVHELFEQQVERTPDASAVAFGAETISYRELNYRSNALAHRLRGQGIGPDSVVAICLERSFDMVISVLATLKAGAAYLPLDPTYPHERLQFMLEDSRAATLLTHRSLQHVFPGLSTPALYLDEDSAQSHRAQESNPPPLSRPDNLSYLIYTSGSTGKPKGVAMIHRALVNLIDWQLKNSRVGPGKRTLQFTSLSFDVSFQEILSTLCSGGTLVLITADLRLSPRELWKFIAREQIARIFLPFVALQQLADAAAAEGTVAPTLREVVTAGEQLQITPKLRELFTRHPQATLHNHYGPSETHVVTALEMSGEPSSWPALPSIGYPIQNTQIYLLDRNRQPVALGLPGELYIGGTALARGYFERPDATTEKFIADPFRQESDARLYRTGDLARYLPDGQIEFLGRIDHQVKIRGYRVELGEIEAALNKQPGVRESAVIAREQSPGQKQLVAYIVPNKPGEANVTTLRASLKLQLPDYMVPAAFVLLDKLPLTPSGKVDRKSLPPPGAASANTVPTNPSERPWLPIQFQLVQIWEELLGVKPVGIRENFFEIGGHSLLAVKMMDRVEEVTGKKLPVTTLFEHATIVALAELILNDDRQTAAPVIEVQTAGDRPPVYFLHGDIIGGGFYARDVSRLLGNQQPFYVLPPKEIAASELSNVEAMAEHHLKDLRAHRPHGPYLLGGFCIGALVAYEMARRLRDLGEEVPLVIMIDPQLPSNLLRAHHWMADRVGRRRNLSAQQKTKLFIKGYKALFRLREEWNAPLRDKGRFIGYAIKRLCGRRNHAEVGAPASSTSQPSDVPVKDEQDTLGQLLWMISAYQPPHYEGRAAIFLTDEQKEFAPFLPRKWMAVSPRVEIHRVPGRHLGAITTDVHVLAASLRACLDDVNAGAPLAPAATSP